MVDEPTLQELSLAESFLGEARTVRQAGALRSAYSRLYYALFHAAKAALREAGSTPKTHRGVLNQIFDEMWGAAQEFLGDVRELIGQRG